jgi:hypothetical protein
MPALEGPPDLIAKSQTKNWGQLARLNATRSAQFDGDDEAIYGEGTRFIHPKHRESTFR